MAGFACPCLAAGTLHGLRTVLAGRTCPCRHAGVVSACFGGSQNGTPGSKTYTEPGPISFALDLRPDTELIENICENEKDVDNMVGK